MKKPFLFLALFLGLIGDQAMSASAQLAEDEAKNISEDMLSADEQAHKTENSSSSDIENDVKDEGDAVTSEEYEDDEDEVDDAQADEGQADGFTLAGQKIEEILVEGLRRIPLPVVLNRIPYTPGESFNVRKTNKLIRNVYDLGYFRQVEVYVEEIDDERINLVVAVDEKRPLEAFKFVGNRHLSENEIKKKIDFSKVPAVDEDDLPKYIKILKRLYRDKDFHDVDIKAELVGDAEKVTLVFTIKEGRKMLVKRVLFEGNDHFRGKKLRSIIFTREDWVLGFLDRAGSFQPDAIEADKQVLENYYQSNGFFNAKITGVATDIEEKTQSAIVTFHVHEGEQYCIREIRVPGNEHVSQEELLARIPIRVGQLYSKELVRETIELLRVIWGQYGYINADIEPSIQPDEDTKTVSLAFYSELGPRVFLNRVNIVGNQKTYDKVIRRQLTVEEGCVLITKAMDESKARVESLGYFDSRDGVNWRIIPIAKDRVDLELIVKEVKTGKIEAQMGFGGTTRDISSPTESFNVSINLADTNLFGRGIQIASSASFSKEERNLQFNVAQPWLFDRPIHASGDMYFKRSIYDDFKFVQEAEVNENITGGTAGIGALSAKLWDSTLALKIGVEGITYKKTPMVNFSGLTQSEIPQLQQFQIILDKRFTSGVFLWLGGYAFKDFKNHPIHPSRGYQYAMFTKVAVHSNLKDNPRDTPMQNMANDMLRTRFGFIKVDFDGSWYTPLIGERDLVLGLHGHMGIVGGIGSKTIPFRELYHIGGPSSVRGFLYGEIGPMFTVSRLGKSDMLGAKKAFWLNAEMVFPVSKDFSMKGAVFYDGGAGWDTPNSDLISPANLRNNSFAFRHSVGFGVRILRPTPIKIDWGFKLDRKRGETASEVHFSMYQEF